MTTESDTDRVEFAWFVNKPRDVDAASMSEYLGRGEWQLQGSTRYAYQLGQMNAGDSIALKSVANRKTGTGFFNADTIVSVMTIYATGRIRSVDPDSGRIHVSWNAMAEPRPWRFFTLNKSPWLVKAETALKRALLDFVFHRADQDIGMFLSEDYWRGRYPSTPDFSWVNFYEAFASRLLEYRNRREELIDLVHQVAESQPLMSYLVNDKWSDGMSHRIADIDPFTLLSAFNRQTTDENRHAVASQLAQALEVHVPAPRGFDGLPLVNNQNSWFVSYTRNRSEGDVEALWSVFAAALRLAEQESGANRESFVVAYDAAVKVRGVRWNLTQGLFWARPERFAPMDNLSRVYLRDRFGVAAPTDGAAYLTVIDELRTILDGDDTSLTSLPELSFAAFFAAQQKTPEHDIEGMAYWACALNEAVDLEAEEHAYKKETADLLRKARDQAQADSPDWVGTFRKAMRSTNVLNFRFIDDVKKGSSAACVGHFRPGSTGF